MADYGYLHTGTVLGIDEVAGTYYVENVAIARNKKLGPYASCIPNLRKGDRIVLGATGTSRDVLTIIGKIGATAPDVADVVGLLDALFSKASDVDLALVRSRVGDIEAILDPLGVTLADLGARLTIVEDGIADHALALAALDDRSTALETRATDLEAVALERPYNRGDQDLHGDLIATVPRYAGTSQVVLPDGVACLYRTYANRVFNYGSFRASVAVAGTGPGTTTCSIYVGTSPSSLILYSTLGIGLATLGEAVTYLSGVTFAGFPHMALGLRASGYTVYPQVACTPTVPHSSLLSPTTEYTAAAKTVASWPSTINLSDGTWSPASAKLWLALNVA